MSHEFHIGQKVVCVDADGPSRSTIFPHIQGDFHASERIVNGQIYTIAAMIFDDDGLIFELCEVRRHPANVAWFAARGTPCGYGAFRFRPLDDSRYDISIFQQMCVDARSHVGAPK